MTWKGTSLAYIVGADNLLHLRGRADLPLIPSTPATSVWVASLSAVGVPDPTAPPAGTLAAGSADVGTTTYPVPDYEDMYSDTYGAIYVATTGNDSTGAGTPGSPYATLAKAVSVAAAGATIVLRAGVYHEGATPGGTGLGVQITASNITIQSYPSEAVWFDGSSTVTGWVADTAAVSGRTVWRRDSWVATFDRGPTFSRGAADSTLADWAFVSTTFPCAAWPEQIWVDGVRQQQVSAVSQVTAGTFYVAGASAGSQKWTSSALYLGTDPTGKTVRVADRTSAVSFTGPGSGGTIRGVGFRNYAPTMADFGALKAWANNTTVENVIIQDSSTIGMSCLGSDITVKDVTVTGAGCMGIHSNNSDDLLLDSVRTEFNNWEHFNYSPAEGGIKVTRQRRTILRNSVVSNNYGKGFWADESVTELQIYTCDFRGNEQVGCIAELCGRVTVADSIIEGNGWDGLQAFNCDTITAWNNTIVNNGGGPNPFTGGLQPSARDFDIRADDRAPMTAGSTGRDTRYSFPHPDLCTWVMSSSVVKNNIIGKGDSKALQAFSAYEDFKKNTGNARSWTTIGINWDGNFYYRLSTTSPSWLFIMANAGSANATILFDLVSFRALVSSEANSYYISGVDALNSDLTLKSAYAAQESSVPRPLPSDIATLIGRTAGTAHLGAWR